MAEFDDKLNSLLSNPEAMDQIMKMAQSLMGGEGRPAAAHRRPIRRPCSSPIRRRPSSLRRSRIPLPEHGAHPRAAALPRPKISSVRRRGKIRGRIVETAAGVHRPTRPRPPVGRTSAFFPALGASTRKPLLPFCRFSES